MNLSITLSSQNAICKKLKQLFNPAFKCSKFSLTPTKLTYVISEGRGTGDALLEFFAMFLRPNSDLKLQCPSSCIPPLSLSLTLLLIWSNSKISSVPDGKNATTTATKPTRKKISFQMVHMGCHFRFPVNAYFFQYWKLNL